MNLYQFTTSTNNKRINNLNMSERSVKKFFSRFDMLRLDIFDIKAIQKPLIFTALYSCRISLYDFRKVHTIEELAVDKPRYSIYQRSCTTDHMISLANDMSFNKKDITVKEKEKRKW